MVLFNPSEQDKEMNNCSGHRDDSQCWIPAGMTEDLRPGPGEELGDQKALLPPFSSTGSVQMLVRCYISGIVAYINAFVVKVV